ncbi:uncharacterized protein PGTG_10460 [Puccinia graminis f. sp. tritici CRL 75-36-700-3]|uniref:Uncharacterized protein n=1 Tax=Puccinia graminis f. sp. tritici (strain CRL 75-36-700-3 / race SCCL) TaxID=418459 RepID=E3KIF7_PUCGT|nr:uncharacterized protein PGTG_10460 [Puccinia graminis f. sp. tritici CRL 75-36-700-3]EFP84082.1 hypothetical protein PGTG_10460 [Puccinia graminis f. sp. tritici CRL 75-36-700-3]
MDCGWLLLILLCAAAPTQKDLRELVWYSDVGLRVIRHGLRLDAAHIAQKNRKLGLGAVLSHTDDEEEHSKEGVTPSNVSSSMLYSPPHSPTPSPQQKQKKPAATQTRVEEEQLEEGEAVGATVDAKPFGQLKWTPPTPHI